tara:strand:- start:38 stop:211 length:174 start_codon:yes stop_codon:yes gene_type:complete
MMYAECEPHIFCSPAINEQVKSKSANKNLPILFNPESEVELLRLLAYGHSAPKTPDG